MNDQGAIWGDMTNEELCEKAARLRGFRPMAAEEVAAIFGYPIEEIHLFDPPLWIWKGELGKQPREAVDITVHWVYERYEDEERGTIICRGYPDYIKGDGWWYLAKELSSSVRQKCVANWREAPRRVVEAFIERGGAR